MNLKKENKLLKNFLKWCVDGDFVPRDYVSTTQLADRIKLKARQLYEKIK